MLKVNGLMGYGLKLWNLEVNKSFCFIEFCVVFLSWLKLFVELFSVVIIYLVVLDDWDV